MGIKDYLKYIDKEEINKIEKYDYLYLDCNFLIHYFIYKCKNDLDLYIKTSYYFKYLFDNIQINKTVYIIFDGKPDINDPKLLTKINRSKNKIIDDSYDKQNLSYKSELIGKYKNMIIDLLDKNIKSNKLNFKYEINDNNNGGEGDFKIFNEIKNQDQDKICILSKDSDMILLSYSLILKKNINIDIIINLRPIEIIDVNKLINDNKSYDYILITMLLGNDYLPKISNINYEALIKTYEKYIKNNNNIIIDNKINYDNFIIYITYLIFYKKNKVKFNITNLDLNRFEIYFNNLKWCLYNYGVLKNSYNYKQFNNLNNVLNIYNFINFDKY
jgi:hypothetical protein